MFLSFEGIAGNDQQGETRQNGVTPGPYTFEAVHESSCWSNCTVNGCSEDHPSGVYELYGPETASEWCERIILEKYDDAAFISASVNAFWNAAQQLSVDPLKLAQRLEDGTVLRDTYTDALDLLGLEAHTA